MKSLFAGLVFALALAARGDGPVKIEGAAFDESVVIHGTPLTLNGAGLLRVAVIFKVYAAALYLGENVTPDRVFEDVPKRLEIAYLRDISTNIIFDAGWSALSNNVPPETLDALRPRIDRINSFYRDVGSGDRYTLTYLPDRGTELALNGESQGTIEGADFAAAYFTIWLGTNVARPELRDALLGKKKVNCASALEIASYLRPSTDHWSLVTSPGGVAERFKAPDLKSGVGASPP